MLLVQLEVLQARQAGVDRTTVCTPTALVQVLPTAATQALAVLAALARASAGRGRPAPGPGGPGRSSFRRRAPRRPASRSKLPARSDCVVLASPAPPGRAFRPGTRFRVKVTGSSSGTSARHRRHAVCTATSVDPCTSTPLAGLPEPHVERAPGRAGGIPVSFTSARAWPRKALGTAARRGRDLPRGSGRRSLPWRRKGRRTLMASPWACQRRATPPPSWARHPSVTRPVGPVWYGWSRERPSRPGGYPHRVPHPDRRGRARPRQPPHLQPLGGRLRDRDHPHRRRGPRRGPRPSSPTWCCWT